MPGTNTSTVTEFVYLRLKPDVKPEDPENEGGKQFYEIFDAVRKSRGYQGGSWGRTAEDQNDVVWLIDWENTSQGVRLSPSLCSLLDESKPPITFHSTLIPPTAKTVIRNPINEIIVLPFPSSYKTPEGKQAIEADLAAYRKKMLELPNNEGPLSFSVGWLGRPEVVKHRDSPTGAALLNCLVIGWRTVKDHMAARETSEFLAGVGGIREKLLPPLEGMDMRHVAFKSI